MQHCLISQSPTRVAVVVSRFQQRCYESDREVRVLHFVRRFSSGHQTLYFARRRDDVSVNRGMVSWLTTRPVVHVRTQCTKSVCLGPGTHVVIPPWVRAARDIGSLWRRAGTVPQRCLSTGSHPLTPSSKCLFNQGQTVQLCVGRGMIVTPLPGISAATRHHTSEYKSMHLRLDPIVHSLGEPVFVQPNNVTDWIARRCHHVVGRPACQGYPVHPGRHGFDRLNVRV
jgi:hypothetical protein